MSDDTRAVSARRPATRSAGHADARARADHHGRSRPTRDALWTLAVLLVVYVLSMYERNVVTMLVPEIKKTLRLSDFQIGLVLGPAFSISFGILSMPLGWAADRYSRRWVLVFGTALFGIATIATGLAWGFISLLLARIAVAVGEASLGPASASLLASKVRRERLATAISVYMTGTKIGTSIAYAVAGVGLVLAARMISEWALPRFAAWQILMVLSGIPAILTGLLILTVSEPRRAAPDNSHEQQGILAFLRAERSLLIPLIVAFSLMSLCANSFVGWIPTYMTRHFGLSKQAFGPILGIYSLIAAGTLVIKGMMVDWLYRRGMKDVHARFYSWLVMGTLPAAVVLFFQSNASVFLVLLALVQVIAIPVTSYAATVIQVITPPALRGQMTAISALFLVSIGGLGPSLVGALTDYVFRNEALLGDSLACVTITVFPLVLFLLRLSLPPLRRRVSAVEIESSGG